MRKALAILFSLLLVWVQAVVGVQATSSRAQDATCPCCDCGKTDCCVAQSSSPGSAPAPAAPVRVVVQDQISFFANASLNWALPGAEACPSSFSVSSPLTTAGVPLFTRHCALLI